jgi:hypothetical protein
MTIDTENIEQIGFQHREEIEWKFKVECTKCHETHAKTISFFPFEEQFPENSNIPPSNFYMKCKFCKNEMAISVIEKNYPAIECNSK